MVLGVVPLRPWGIVVIVAAGAVDVGESLFWIWLSKRRKAALGAEALVGDTAAVVRACRPNGLVRLHGELWQARCDEGADEGDEVRVREIRGLTLLVERA